MGQIEKVTQMTETKFLNLYHLQGKNKIGGPINYFVASRAKSQEMLKLKTRNVNSDGVIIYSIVQDKVVLVKQYRYTIDDYIYEFPAGLVDPGEDYDEAAVRELWEETGLELTPIEVPQWLKKPAFTSIGMSDEACATVFGYAKGNVTQEHLEDNEEIEIVLADRKEVMRILKEENLAIMTAYMLMHFVSDEEPLAFLKTFTDNL